MGGVHVPVPQGAALDLFQFALIGALVANLFLAVDPPLSRPARGAGRGLFVRAVLGRWVTGTGAVSHLLRLTTMFATMNAALLVGFWRWASSHQTGLWNVPPDERFRRSRRRRKPSPIAGHFGGTGDPPRLRDCASAFGPSRFRRRGSSCGRRWRRSWRFAACGTTRTRLLICEPLFKAHCQSSGRGVTDVFIHWITGRGDIIIGDDVLVDGKCSITFASRYAAAPSLIVGDHTGIGHGCTFSMGQRITIGRHCRIAAHV